jgi:hypothetical protein
MSAQSVAGLPANERDSQPFWPFRRWRFGEPLPRRVVARAAAVGAAVAVLTYAALAVAAPRFGWFARPAPPPAATLGEGSPWPSPVPVIRSSELWYATTPTRGVWAELKIVLDNPLRAGPTNPTRTTILVSGTLMEDFRIRSTEPNLLVQPRRRPDGRYALVYPAPLPESLNWYRVYLETRKSAPRPLSLGFMLEGQRNLEEQTPVPAQIFFADRQADPFRVVPEPLVSWVPGQAGSAFPILVLYAVAIGSVAAAGCVAAFWAVRR